MKKLLSLLSVFVMSMMICISAFANEETTETGKGSITGEITVKGKGSMAGGTVFFFNEDSGPPPSDTKYWRVPTDAFSLDENGRFDVMLTEGNYYMGAIKRLSRSHLGPPQDGDLFFINRDENGNLRLHTVMQFKPVNLSVISGVKIFNRKSLVTEGITSIQGTILDGRGKPAKGMIVLAFPSQVMFGRPLFVSERSDKDGKYLLRFYEGGKYYLSSRADYGGGPPTVKESLGSYGNGQPINLKTGEMKKGIDITLHRVGEPE